uniref:Uncharacterized protein n=1 Tax=Arundo donax TaxID=35708 RepID=A0A0A9AT29_ARUDO
MHIRKVVLMCVHVFISIDPNIKKNMKVCLALLEMKRLKLFKDIFISSFV